MSNFLHHVKLTEYIVYMMTTVNSFEAGSMAPLQHQHEEFPINQQKSAFEFHLWMYAPDSGQYTLTIALQQSTTEPYKFQRHCQSSIGDDYAYHASYSGYHTHQHV